MTACMRKAFRYRLYPTKAQWHKMERTLELCRWVYNETLSAKRKAWDDEEKNLSLYATNKLLTNWKRERPELNSVFSQVAQ